MSADQSKASLRRILGRTAAMLLTAAMIIGTGLFAALGETVEELAGNHNYPQQASS